MVRPFEGLLRKQNGQPLAEQATRRFVQGVDDGGGKAETWLVQHQGLWIAHQRTLDRQHLALLAGHGAGTLVAPLREFRKNCINPFQQRCYPRTVGGRRRAEQEIALDAVLHEHRLRRRRFIAGSSKGQ